MYNSAVAQHKQRTMTTCKHVQLNPPPLKNPNSTNSSAPSSSNPTPTSDTLCRSSRGFRRLITTAPLRHNCHPNRRMNMMTTSFSAHTLSTGTDCRESKLDEKQLNYASKPLSWYSFESGFSQFSPIQLVCLRQ